MPGVGTAGVDPSRTPTRAAGTIEMWLTSGLPGAMWILASTSLEPDRVDDRPGLLPGRLQRLAELVVERQVLGLDLQVDLERGLAIGEVGPVELLDPAVARDDRLAVPPAHVLEDPEVGVELEPAGQVADRVGEARPGDLAPGVEVEDRRR